MFNLDTCSCSSDSDDFGWLHNHAIVMWPELMSQSDELIHLCGLDFITLQGVSECEMLCVPVRCQTPLIGSARSSVTAEEPISRSHWPSPLSHLDPKRGLQSTTWRSCRRISLPLPLLTAQPTAPPPLKMNVEVLLKWRGRLWLWRGRGCFPEQILLLIRSRHFRCKPIRPSDFSQSV